MDEVVVVLLLGLVMWGGLIWWVVSLSRPGSTTVQSGMSPREAVDAAVQNFTARGWMTTSQSGRDVSFSRQRTPGCLVTLVLLMFGILPGLLYWGLVWRRTLSVSVTARKHQSGQGSTVQLSWSRKLGGKADALGLRQIVSSSAAPTTTSFASSPAQQALPAEDSPRNHAEGGPASVPGPEAADPIQSGPSCAGCGSIELTAEEKERNPVLCDSCLSGILPKKDDRQQEVREPFAQPRAEPDTADTAPPVPDGESLQPSSRPKFCRNCGTGLMEDDLFCGGCGKPVAEA